MVLILQKVDTIGFLKLLIQLVKICLHILGPWIWKHQLPEKYKFLVWLAIHNVVPTLSLLNHKNITPFATCSCCDVQEETFLHCVRDCTFSVRL